MTALFLIVFIDLAGFGLIIPLLPFYAERFQAGPLTVALLMASFSAAQLVTAPLWGRLSDRVGRRPVLAGSMAGAVAAYLAIAVAPSLWALFAARALAGAMAGNIAAAFAYAADITRPEDRARGMGLVSAALGLGFIVGPAAGGLLAGADPAAADFTTPALAAAALSALALGLTLARLPESLPPEARAARAATRRRNAFAEFADGLRRPRLRPLFGIGFLATFVFAGIEATFAIWSERRFGWGPMQNGWFMAALGVVGVAVQGGLAGILARRFGEAALVAAGAVLFAAGLALTPLASSVPQLAAAMTPLALGFALLNPALNSLLSRRAGAGEQGLILGMSRSAATLGRVAGPAWAGLLFAHVGADGPFLGGALVMAAVAGLALLPRSRGRD